MGKDVMDEIGQVSKKIAVLLSKNQELCRLLKYTDSAPLSKSKEDWDISKNSLIQKNILIIPKVNVEELTDSKVVINIPYAGVDQNNDDFAEITLYIDVFTKMDQWVIEDENDVLRPFKIMSVIKKSLNRKRLSSIGTVEFSSFTLEILDNDVACHHMVFYTSANDFNEN